MTVEVSTRSNRSRALITGLIVGSLAAAFWLGTQVSFGASGRTPKSAAPSLITTPIESRVLTSTLGIPGTIAPANRVTVSLTPFSIPNTEAIVTATPPPLGTVIITGSVLGTVSGAPIFAMPGTTPMYREMTRGETGSDIQQLQLALTSLGYAIDDVSGVLGPSTATAYWQFLISRGVDPSEFNGSSPDKIKVPDWQVVFVSTLPAVVASEDLKLGQPPPASALVLDAGTLTFQGALNGAQEATLGEGDPAMISLADGQRFKGRITSLRSRRMVVGAFVRPLPASSARQQVIATVTIASTGRPVLAVPASALLTLSSGQVGVQVLAGGELHEDPVQVGVSIGGMVSIIAKADSLRAGDLVVVPT